MSVQDTFFFETQVHLRLFFEIPDWHARSSPIFPISKRRRLMLFLFRNRGSSFLRYLEHPSWHHLRCRPFPSGDGGVERSSFFETQAYPLPIIRELRPPPSLCCCSTPQSFLTTRTVESGCHYLVLPDIAPNPSSLWTVFGGSLNVSNREDLHKGDKRTA